MLSYIFLTLLFLLVSVCDNAGHSVINPGTNALSSADHPSVEIQWTHQTASGAHPSAFEWHLEGMHVGSWIHIHCTF